MSDLTIAERTKLERLLQMSSGYVLSFSNHTLTEFVAESTGRDIYDAKYGYGSGSKANRLRAFWSEESNPIVAKLVHDLLEHCRSIGRHAEEAGLFQECERIARRLNHTAPVEAIDVIVAEAAEPGFDILAKAVRQAIETHQPEAGLDRLHTFVTKLIRTWLQKRSIAYDRDKALHSIFGEYVKALRNSGHIESEMTDRILKSSISIMEAFNRVRNMESLAHDNPTLSYDESLLICDHVCSTVRFLKAIEAKVERNTTATHLVTPDAEDIPF